MISKSQGETQVSLHLGFPKRGGGTPTRATTTTQLRLPASAMTTRPLWARHSLLRLAAAWGKGDSQEWNKKSTQEIIDSLAPGKPTALTVYPDGAIANGNSRITILKERGIDVDNLPRDIINRTPVPDAIEPK